jgi:putative molybdopterin biosynthesis protein
VRRLRALLAAPAWHAALRALPGYAPLHAAGQVLALTRALPWWRLRPRRPTPAEGR